MAMKRILTVAGSDSGGGAGIQADIKAVTVLGGYGMSVLTALTAQNTKGVLGIHKCPPDFVRLQLSAVLDDIGADAVKTGMLADAETIGVVSDVLAEYRVPNLVVDPVMVAASGGRLLAEDAAETLKTRLLPIAVTVTPNLEEAAILSGLRVETLEDMREAARAIHDLGPKTVLVKGGHLKDRAVDLFYDGRDFVELDGNRIDTQSTHGSGCTMSAALAFFLARGDSTPDAVLAAKAFITEAIRHSIKIGSGYGPTNPYAHIARYVDREPVLVELRRALEMFLRKPLGALIPEIRSNLGYALSGARDYRDVAAIPGRITNVGARPAALAEPAFGASRHVAKVILAAMRHDPASRAAMNIRYDESLLNACKEAGLIGVYFDRAEEPEEIRIKEGSSLEWGTGRALDGLTYTPDYIFDRGGFGKEPVIRVLGRSPVEVVEKVIAVGKCWT